MSCYACKETKEDFKLCDSCLITVLKRDVEDLRASNDSLWDKEDKADERIAALENALKIAISTMEYLSSNSAPVRYALQQIKDIVGVPKVNPGPRPRDREEE